MAETNPIAFASDLHTVLSRYIATTLPISRRYPRLAAEFRELLAGEQLIQGPFVEALPDFEKGDPLSALLRSAGGFLHDSLGKLPTAGRRLHKHQQEALTRAVMHHESLLTATGTGSGKTETFLYPIAHHLLADMEPDKPGVRALLIYPMNALANDQLYYRIAPLFARYLLDHGITFGRYTGQVKARAKRTEEEAKLQNNPKLMEALGHPSSIPKNWLLTRDEMLADPPKVLVTNYAMLEHLLLLPRNAGLFATNSLRFIVLDEIHTYYGAQASEVAFLLRKLKTRLGSAEPIQVFGTSASLSSEEGADEALIKFGTDLLGEPVQRVIRGRRIAHADLTRDSGGLFSLSVSQWHSVGAVLAEALGYASEDQTVDCWNALLAAHDPALEHLKLAGPGSAEAWTHLVGPLSRNDEIRAVAVFLGAGGVAHFAQLAQRVFASHQGEESERHKALSAVIQAGMMARSEAGEFPLLPGRYHIAVNSIEGLAVLPDKGGEGWSRLKVARHYNDESGQYFPLLTCRKCGQAFMEGWKDHGHVRNRRPDSIEVPSERIVFWLGQPVGGTEDEEDEGQDEQGAGGRERMFVEPVSGEIVASASAIPLFPVHTETDELERATYVKRCPACGGRSTGAEAEVVTRMHPGNEALGAVVTQRVLEALPPGVIDHADPRPAFGRSLLTFSDNRQDAAFFAPYFERTAANVALRSAVRHVLIESASPIPVPQLADQVYDYWRRDGGQPLLLDELGEIRTDKHDVTSLLQGALGYEFCTPSGRRNSLESLGVALVTYESRTLEHLYRLVKPFWPSGLPDTSADVAGLCHSLLESVRRERALQTLHKVSLTDKSVWGDYNQHRTFDIEAGDDDVRFKWLPSQQGKRHNRRSWYLVEQLGLTREDAMQFLRQLWDVLVKPPISLMKRYPPGFGLDGNQIRIRDGSTAPLLQCTSCGLLQRHALMKRCTAFGCKGEAVELDAVERARLGRENHYLASYNETSHLTLRAREHTASLSTELREEIEREFSERRLNLLSCTTTMEMGVDLGDLEAVVNLNVPPGIANYQQRTGRAGRRAQAAPFCVTVARNTSYDQAVFRDLKGYLLSSPSTPFVNLGNAELFLRHQMSIVLSHFLRKRIARLDVNAPSLKELFGAPFPAETKTAFLDDLNAWVENEQGAAAFGEAEMLGATLPAEFFAVASKGPHLRSAVVSRLREFAEDVAERCAGYEAREKEAAAANEYKKAAYWMGQREQYMDQFLVNELSRRGLIPTYSFPVHSLTLEVQDGAQANAFHRQAAVALTRDATFGISEYAPGAEVVANGRIWESAGLAKYPKAFMPERWYAACSECFHVDIGDTFQDIPSACTNCSSAENRRKRRFVEPRGFVTSAQNKIGKDPGSSRRRVKPADEARLIAAPRPEQFQETELPFLRTALLLARGSEDSELRGSLFVANRGMYGEGYSRCTWCNYCEPFRKASAAKAAGKGKAAGAPTKKFVHHDPVSGARCSNDLLPKLGLDFAHAFETDVLLLRFLAPLPEPKGEESSRRRYQEHLARTVAEACRLGATDLLHLHPGELRSTYRLYSTAGNTLEVVLYDGVPGGAGYSARLGSPGFSFSSLVQAARRRLECPASCDAACRACLCDYGNQRHWDSFQRKDALAWMDALLADDTQQAGPGGYVPWPRPSLAGLSERLAPHSTISIIATSLISGDSFSEPDLNELTSWLQAGKYVRLYLANKVEAHPREAALLLLYRHLYPWASQGKLSLFALDESAAQQATQLPRIFADLQDGTPLFRQAFAVQGVFQGMVVAPVELGSADTDTRALVAPLLAAATPYAASVLCEGEKMGMWEFPAGELRDLAKVFAAVAGVHIKKLVIKDPYCGQSNNRRRVQELVRYLKTHALALDCVHVYCSEQRDRDGHVEYRHDIARQLELLMKQLGVENCEAFVKELGRNRAFHDRELAFEVADASGSDVLHRYFLTGGLDYLLDERSDTKVFHARTDS
jgi:hypothetical protein